MALLDGGAGPHPCRRRHRARYAARPAARRTDVDLATELLPHEVILRAERAGIAAYPTGIEHGTVTLKLGTLVAEVTTLREDIDTDGRRAVVQFGTDWKQRRGAARFHHERALCRHGRHAVRSAGRTGRLPCRTGPFHRRSGAAHRGGSAAGLPLLPLLGEPWQRALDAEGYAACRAAADQLGTALGRAGRLGNAPHADLPRVATTLKAMSDAGMLTLSAETVKLLHQLRAPGPASGSDGAAGDPADRRDSGRRSSRILWRLSNDEVAAAEAILTVAGLLRDYRLNEAAYRHPAALADGVDVATVLADWSGGRPVGSARPVAAPRRCHVSRSVAAT